MSITDAVSVLSFAEPPPGSTLEQQKRFHTGHKALWSRYAKRALPGAKEHLLHHTNALAEIQIELAVKINMAKAPKLGEAQRNRLAQLIAPAQAV